MEKKINIAKDYSPVLGGRWIALGPHSGEDFYNTILEPSFGELGRNYGVQKIRNLIEFKTNIFQWVVDYINKEIWDKTK